MWVPPSHDWKSMSLHHLFTCSHTNNRFHTDTHTCAGNTGLHTHTMTSPSDLLTELLLVLSELRGLGVVQFRMPGQVHDLKGHAQKEGSCYQEKIRCYYLKMRWIFAVTKKNISLPTQDVSLLGYMQRKI